MVNKKVIFLLVFGLRVGDRERDQLPHDRSQSRDYSKPFDSLVVLANDLGYSDIGPIRREMKTPSIDAECMMLTQLRAMMMVRNIHEYEGVSGRARDGSI